jgi:hypothetical protein
MEGDAPKLKVTQPCADVKVPAVQVAVSRYFQRFGRSISCAMYS